MQDAVSWPLYIVVLPDGGDSFIPMLMGSDAIKSLPLFTTPEKAFVYQERWNVQSRLYEIPNRESLKDYVARITITFGIAKLPVDTDPITGLCTGEIDIEKLCL